MRTVTIMQARTSSSRLPAKALLPIEGYPSAVLATLRAGNRDAANQNAPNREHGTIFATSDDSSDDELARQARERGLTVFRGPLHDVLGRYYLACAQFPDDCTVIRVTADNMLPDGGFLRGLAEAFTAAGVDYMGTDWPLCGLPYGLSGEAFSVSVLRKAHREATDASDREHVGPWIKRNCRSTFYRPQGLGSADFSHLRCTIDDEEDYRRMVCLFDQVADPIGVRWHDLLHKLARLPGEPTFRVPYRIIAGRAHSELTLGTAQLGMEYGAVNDHGQPSTGQAVAIVRKAIAHGVTAVDTGRVYGTAEEILGKALSGAWSSRAEVITKLDLSGLTADASEAQVRSRVDASIALSCRALGRSRLTVVLLHRWQDRGAWQGTAWHRLLELREAGTIAVLGASVYQPQEALEALDDPALEHLQIPLNVLDWRWEAAGVDRVALRRPEVIVHARSALLQGVLAHPPNRWPNAEDFRAVECSQILERLAQQFGRESVTDLCLAYPRSLGWVTSAVVGCETAEQLEENLRLSRTAKLSAEQCRVLRQELPRAPEKFLNPSKWTKQHEYSAKH